MHGLPSLQLTPAPGLQTPPLHASLLVQLSPSLHGLPSLAAPNLQPLAGSQLSLVHTLLSAHGMRLPAHLPFTHPSPVVQALPSSQVPLVLAVKAQPLPSTHTSSVQTLLSLQTTGVDDLHVPFAHASLVVQTSPSLHARPSLAALNLQPKPNTHTSLVHGLPSLQKTWLPTHPPLVQTSLLVHELPSSQETPLPLSLWLQPLVESHASSVQTLPSSQEIALPLQVPLPHLSPLVQALPSSHAPLRLLCPQPLPGLQVSVVQILPSSQLIALPELHLPLAQMSPVVQALPSSQAIVLAPNTQPLLSSQESVVQGLPSLHVTLTPTQNPPWHASFLLHAWPSLHTVPSEKVLVQPLEMSQASLVQGLPSSHLALLPPTHLPPAQPSPTVHALPSVQVPAPGKLAQPLMASQESMVHGLPSPQFTPPPDLHAPLEQLSPLVQALPSLQVPPMALWVQPLVVSQPSAVQTLPSSQPIAVPLQLPCLHASLAVQALPSAQGMPSRLACSQPTALSQLSLVHGLPSSQSMALPDTHLPPLQPSPSVQAVPSLHGSLLALCTQPTASLQLSLVHGLSSAQLGTLPAHEPWKHTSLTLQTWPSSHAAPSLLVCTQPLKNPQESMVHASPSSQSTLLPGLHTPPTQPSPLVQALPSSQLPSVLACVQPLAGSQPSLVQGLPSSQPMLSPGAHTPSTHMSAPVQALPSAQAPLVWACTQPPLASQPSLVHGLPSSQLMILPTQLSPTQTSPLVQSSPSLQLPTRSVLVQPLATSHASWVHGLPSSQLTALEETHAPPLHWSPPEHALPSSQVMWLGKCTQPLPSAHVSSVQGLPSAQAGTMPTQLPCKHASLTLHFWPSSQMFVLSVVVQPNWRSHTSFVHGLPSSQVIALTGTQNPWLHWSPLVQALPSLQEPLAGAWMQPLKVSQLSSVQTLPSSQPLPVPPVQPPFMHRSPPVQGLPSLQVAPLAKCTQPLALSQLSSVHGLASLQSTVTPLHSPSAHKSPPVHALPSLQNPLNCV